MRDLTAARRILGSILGVLALSTALGACGEAKKAAAPPKPTLTITAVTVTQTALPRTVDASGTIAAWQEVPVGSEAGGLAAVGVYVDEGAYVREGQVIVKLDDRLLRAQVGSAQATVNQAANALKRAQELAAKGYLSRAALDNAVANHAVAAAALAEARVRLDQTNVRAPVSGQITSRSVVKGQIVAAGTELFRLVRQSQIELNAQIPEAELRLVRPGMSATITGDQQAGAVGTVRLVTPQVDPQTRLGFARISLPANSGFRPGNFARARINVGAMPANVVPAAAIVYREGKPGVYVVDANSRVHFRPVKLGDRAGGMVALEEGVTAGQRIAVGGAGFLSEGNLVTVGAARAAAAPARPAAK